MSFFNYVVLISHTFYDKKNLIQKVKGQQPQVQRPQEIQSQS